MSGLVDPASTVDVSNAPGMKPITLRTLQIGDEWLEERAGGLQRYFTELLEHLPATGTDYTGLVVGSERVAHSTGGKVIGYAPADASLLQRLVACRRAIGSLHEIDLIAVHFALYGLPWLDQLGSTPTVVHFHGPWAAESGVDGAVAFNARLKSMIESQVYRRARLLIVLSRSFQHELVHRFGISEEQVRVVPGGVDLERFHSVLTRRQARERLGWPQDRFIVVSVRRLVRRMGLENLIDAVHEMVGRGSDILVLLGGSGPLAAELQQRIKDRGLDANVRMLGRIADEDLPTAYRAADLSLVPSQALEGFGLITLESLACGTPVVVTPVGGLPETIEPFAPECVLANTSTGEISEVLREFMMGQRQLPTEERCRRYAVEHFSWSRIAERVRAVYDEARL